MFRRFLGDIGAEKSIRSITPQEAWERLSRPQSNSMLIDVREPWEYSNGYAKGAKNIPLSQLSQRFNEIPADRDILLICQSGSRSRQAAALLQQRNIPHVTNVTGGTSIWKVHGLPMEHGKHAR